MVAGVGHHVCSRKVAWKRGWLGAPPSPWKGIVLDKAPEVPSPPGQGSRGTGWPEVPLIPAGFSRGLSLSWEAVAQLHLVVCPLMAAVALQPPRCHLVCDGAAGGSPVWGCRPQPCAASSTNPCAWGGIADPLPSPEGFQTIVMFSSLCHTQKCRNVAEIPVGKEFWGLCSTQTWLGLWQRPPCSLAPRIPGILLARCPKLRAWRGASLALLPRAAQGLA